MRQTWDKDGGVGLSTLVKRVSLSQIGEEGLMRTMNKTLTALLTSVLIGLCPWYAVPAFSEEAVLADDSAVEVVVSDTESDVTTTEGISGDRDNGIEQKDDLAQLPGEDSDEATDASKDEPNDTQEPNKQVEAAGQELEQGSGMVSEQVDESDSKPEPDSETVLMQTQESEPEAGTVTDQEDASEPDLTGKNIVAAMKEFGVANDKVLVASTVDELVSKLAEAKRTGTEATPVIVYVMPGNYTLTDKIRVEKNVILVSEVGVTFTASYSGDYMVVLGGSLYGGTFNLGEVKTGICGSRQAFTAKNGFVEYVTVNGNPGKSDGNAGIMMYDGTTGATIKYCTVKGTKNGIKATKRSSVKSITNCTVKDCGYGAAGSGIDIGESNVGTIANNTISGCKGHRISTGTNESAGIPCEIGSITNNTIKYNYTLGVYIEGNCRVKTSFTGNTITGNVAGGVGIRSDIHNTDGTYSKTHYTTYIKGVKNNKIYSNKGTNISVKGKMATIYIVSGNSVNYSKTSCGLALGEGAKAYISGSKNIFSGNKTAGAIINGSSYLKVSGTLNRFDKNKAQGISVGKAKVIVSGAKCTFSGNAKHGVSITAGGVVNITGKNLRILSNKYNGVNLTGKGAYFKATSSGGTIYKNGNIGISLGNKSKAAVKYVKFSGNKKMAVYVGKGCRFTYSKTNLSKRKGAANRLYIA